MTFRVLENIISRYEGGLTRGINPLPTNTPLLNMPAETIVNTNLNDAAIYYDFQNYLNGIYQQIYKNNKWVALSVKTSGKNAVRTEPYFVLESQKEVRDTTNIETISKILLEPNHNETWFSLGKKTYDSLKLYGNSYWQVILTLTGRLHSLYHIPAETIKPVPYLEKSTGLLRFYYVQVQYINEYTYRVNRIFKDSEIIHFKMPNMFSELMGMSDYYPILKSVDFDESLSEWLDGYINNSLNAGTIIEQKNTSPDAVDRNRQILKEQWSGGRNSFNVMLLEGELTLKDNGNKSKDFPLDRIGYLNRNDIMIAADVPLSVCGIRSDQGTLNAEVIESEEQAFLRNNILPLQEIVFSTLNLRLFNQILNMPDLRISAGINNQFNRKNVSALVLTAMKIGATVDELRKLLGLGFLNDETGYGKTVIVGTNNGAVPLEYYFKSIELDSKIKEQTLKNSKLEQNSPKNSETEIPSVSVSSDGTNLK